MTLSGSIVAIFQHQVSLFHIYSMSGARESFNRLVWAPDPKDGYKLCVLRDIGSETMSVEPIDGGLIVNIFH